MVVSHTESSTRPGRDNSLISQTTNVYYLLDIFRHFQNLHIKPLSQSEKDVKQRQLNAILIEKTSPTFSQYL
jgi:hypothetical protein